MILVRRGGTPLVLVLLIASAVHAAPADPPSKAKAKEEYAAGTVAYGLGRYTDAAAHFERAYELGPEPAILFNAAQAHRAAGERSRALVLYRNYLRLYSSKVANGTEVRSIIGQLERELAHPAPAAPLPAEPLPAVALAAAPTSVATTDRTPASARPLIARPWFWAVLGGGAALAATAIALGVVYGTSYRDPTPTLGTWSF